MIAHVGLLAASQLVPPPVPEAEERATEQRRDMIRHYLATAERKEAEREEAERRDAEQIAEADVDPGDGTRTRCEEGTMGNPRSQASRDAEEFGMYTLREPFLVLGGPGQRSEQMNRLLDESLPDLREFGEVATRPPPAGDLGLPFLADDRLAGRCDSWGPQWDGYIAGGASPGGRAASRASRPCAPACLPPSPEKRRAL